MVAASKLRRAQERIQQARPFATQMLRVLNSLASRVDPAAHPLLDERTTPRAGGRTLLFVITADRGLCGSFNANVIKAAGHVHRRDPTARWRSACRPARPRLLRASAASRSATSGSICSRSCSSSDARDIARTAIEAFTIGEVDSVSTWSTTSFDRCWQQRVVVEQLLPIPARSAFEAPAQPADAGGRAVDRLPLRAERRRAVHDADSDATSKCRSTAPCSNRTRRSTPRR